jgi:hypothetical protein
MSRPTVKNIGISTVFEKVIVTGTRHKKAAMIK